MKNLHNKIFESKKEIGNISKDSTNPFFKSKYFDINSLLNHVEPILEKNNLLLLQPIIDDVVLTKIIDLDSGDFVSSGVRLSENKDPQKLGSEITYFRRYTLQSLLGLQAEDDDGNKASNKTKKTPTITSIDNYEKLKSCKTLNELKSYYMSLTVEQQKNLSELKDELKLKLM